MAGERPRGLAEMMALSRLFATDEGHARGLALRVRPNDIFISPYAKCGTTWMQQIVHGLRTGGSMDFDEITEVVPWLEMAHDMGTDPEAPQVGSPRAFKSHLGWESIPKGGRYIVVLRDPIDAMLSLHRYFEGWWFEAGTITPERFARYYLLRSGGGWWGHAASWWRQRRRGDVLFFTYEQMTRDLPGVVDRVADFMGIDNSRTRAIATEQARFAFMKRHARQFDDHLVRAARDPAMGLPPDSSATKIDKGHIGAEVSDRIRSAFARRWKDTMGREFGLPSYSALDMAVSAQA